MSTPQYGGPTSRRPLPLSPPPPTREGGNGARPATVDPLQAPPVDRPGRPRFDGWAGPPPHLDPENQVDFGDERRPRAWPLVLAALGVVAAVGIVAAIVVTGDGGS